MAVHDESARPIVTLLHDEAELFLISDALHDLLEALVELIQDFLFLVLDLLIQLRHLPLVLHHPFFMRMSLSLCSLSGSLEERADGKLEDSSVFALALIQVEPVGETQRPERRDPSNLHSRRPSQIEANRLTVVETFAVVEKQD